MTLLSTCNLLLIKYEMNDLIDIRLAILLLTLANSTPTRYVLVMLTGDKVLLQHGSEAILWYPAVGKYRRHRSNFDCDFVC